MTLGNGHGTMTRVMLQTISKSQFKSQVLEYLREVEANKQPLVITHAGKPVVQVTPFKDKSVLDELRNTVLYYKSPTKPVSENTWEALK